MGRMISTLTFTSTIILQPLTREGPFVQPVIETLNDEGFSTKYNMQQNQLIKCLQALGLDHVT